MTSTPDLTIEASVSNDGLELRYTLLNDLAESILVFDKLRKRNEEELDPEQIYRYVAESKLRLLLGPAPLPRGRNVFARNIPYVTRLDAGQRMTSKLKLTAPLKEYSAYFAGHNESSAVVKTRELELWVAYLPAKGVELAPFAALPNAFKVITPGAPAGAITLHSNTVSLALDVLVTRDEHFSRPVLPTNHR